MCFWSTTCNQLQTQSWTFGFKEEPLIVRVRLNLAQIRSRQIVDISIEEPDEICASIKLGVIEKIRLYVVHVLLTSCTSYNGCSGHPVGSHIPERRPALNTLQLKSRLSPYR